jgi:hypothetical protein
MTFKSLQLGTPIFFNFGGCTYPVWEFVVELLPNYGLFWCKDKTCMINLKRDVISNLSILEEKPLGIMQEV